MLSKLSSRFEDPNPCLFFNQNPTQIKNIAQIQPRSPPSLQGGVSQGDVLCGLKRPDNASPSTAQQWPLAPTSPPECPKSKPYTQVVRSPPEWTNASVRRSTRRNTQSSDSEWPNAGELLRTQVTPTARLRLRSPPSSPAWVRWRRWSFFIGERERRRRREEREGGTREEEGERKERFFFFNFKIFFQFF